MYWVWTPLGIEPVITRSQSLCYVTELQSKLPFSVKTTKTSPPQVFVPWSCRVVGRQATASIDNFSPYGMMEKEELLTNRNASLICFVDKTKMCVDATRNERRQYNRNGNLGVAKMNSDSTCTNFNIQQLYYHARCIEIDIAWNNIGTCI